MVSASNLPPARSTYDYPVVMPGQEITPEQQEQASVAQIAGIVTAAAAGKKAISDTVTMQIVALLRGADLVTEAGIRAFAAQAAIMVRAGIKQSQMVAWSGFAARARVAEVPFPATPPLESEIPKDLRQTRKTSLEAAYARLGDEYQRLTSKGVSTPAVAALVAELESAKQTPIPRPDRISSDAVESGGDYDQKWREAFQKAEEEARKTTGRKEPQRPATSPYIAPEKAREITELAREIHQRDDELRAFSGGESEYSGSVDEDRPKPVQDSESRGSNRTDETPRAEPLVSDRPQLTEDEILRVVERYAQQKVEERAQRMVEQDIQAASRNMHQVAMRQAPKGRVVGFRRVIHPELSESGQSCGLCVVASTNRYSRGDLMPIHSGCNCETAEIYKTTTGEFDPGQQINLADLEVFYSEAKGSTHGWDLKRSRYKVIDHPEYGPTLVNADEKKAREFVEIQQRNY